MLECDITGATSESNRETRVIAKTRRKQRSARSFHGNLRTRGRMKQGTQPVMGGRGAATGAKSKVTLESKLIIR